MLLGALVGLMLGCAGTYLDRETTRQTWEEHDLQRSRECQARGGLWVSGSCVSAGGGR
jgi:hypothetical protein